MPWIIVAVAVIIFGLAALAATGKFGEMPAEPGDDTYAPTLPDRALTSEDLRSLRFGVQLRGYDMHQVDALLSRMADQLDGRTPAAAVAAFPAPGGTGIDASTDELTALPDELPAATEPAVADELPRADEVLEDALTPEIAERTSAAEADLDDFAAPSTTHKE